MGEGEEQPESGGEGSPGWPMLASVRFGRRKTSQLHFLIAWRAWLFDFAWGIRIEAFWWKLREKQREREKNEDSLGSWTEAWSRRKEGIERTATQSVDIGIYRRPMR
ncbi:hypothetical protein QOT17_001000 [Balamuthia mandrillaris]